MILQVIFTISHGQASVERGFSANKNLLVENVEELAIQSCLIKDSLTVWIYLTKRCSMLKMLDRYESHFQEAATWKGSTDMHCKIGDKWY